MASKFVLSCLQRQDNKSVLSGEGKAFICTVIDNGLLKMLPRGAAIGREIDFQRLSTSNAYDDPRKQKNTT